MKNRIPRIFKPEGRGKHQQMLKKMRLMESCPVASNIEYQAINAAAKSLGMKVTLRTMPSGIKMFWRVK